MSATHPVSEQRPQPEVAWVETAPTELVAPPRSRANITISKPKAKAGQMWVMIHIEGWAGRAFCIPLSSIDSPAVSFNVMWKFAGDEQYVIQASAEITAGARTTKDLSPQKWSFARI
jgi:hypothetical protein